MACSFASWGWPLGALVSWIGCQLAECTSLVASCVRTWLLTAPPAACTHIPGLLYATGMRAAVEVVQLLRWCCCKVRIAEEKYTKFDAVSTILRSPCAASGAKGNRRGIQAALLHQCLQHCQRAAADQRGRALPKA